MTSHDMPPPEFSMEVDLGEIGKGEKNFRLSAGEEERRKIAVRLKIPAVDMFEGDIRLRATKSDIFVAGHVRAQLTRECVASLELMREDVAEPFEIHFIRQADDEIDAAEEADIDAPELHDGETIDIGELLVQQLALAMDPFPRIEGASSLSEAHGGEGDISPFAALRGAFKKSDAHQ